MKNNRMDFGLASLCRILATLMAVFIVCGGYAQDKHFARPLTLDADTVKLITVYTFDNDSTIRWIKGTKDKPKGTITDSSFYVLLHDAYLPTLKEKSGNMLYDGEMIPLDGVVFGSIKVSNYANRKKIVDIPELKLSLEWRRTVFGYDTTRIVYGSDTIQVDKKLYEKYKDSIEKSRTEDKVVLRVECDKLSDTNHHFAILVKDLPEPIKRKDFIIGKEIELEPELIATLGISLNEEQTSVKPIERIAVVARGCLYSFIKEVGFSQDEVRKDILKVPKQEFVAPLWIWILLGALVLAVLCFFALRFFSKSKPKGKQRKKITFKLSNYLTDNNYNEVVGKLRTSSDPSMNFKEDPEDKVVSFVVTDGNAALFAESIEKQQGFFYELKKCIEEAKPDNLPKQKKNAFEGEIRAAKEQLKEIGDFVTRLLGKKDEAGKGEQADEIVENLPQTSEELEKELEEYKEAFRRLAEKLELDKGLKFDEAATKLEKAVENWAGVKKALALETPKDSSAVVNRISTLEKEVDDLNTSINWLRKEKEEQENIVKDWKKQTGYNEPEKAKKDIENIEKIKKAPRSFKGDKDFKKLSDLIVDAEEGSKVRDNMNNDPSAIDPNSATGILVRKGRLFDKYVVIIADEIFKKKDAEIIIEDKIKNCPIAIQVKKGDFLDKAKDDVAMIRKDEEGWIGDCELKTFIEYIVNPHEILKSKTRTNTGLYKLMNDIESVIRPNNENHRAINMSDLQYNWLKDRMGNVMDNYNYLLLVERFASEYIAFKLGAAEPDTSNLKGDVKEVFDDAKSYVKFNKYKLYWKNIAGPLFDTLDGLPAHDEIHNTRALMFYTSQFYSIACIMNEIYGDLSYSTIRPNLNVGLFNTNAAPVPTHMGFPQLDSETLQKCKFEYKGASEEDAKVKYLKQYKPLPFILIFSYFDDNTLS